MPKDMPSQTVGANVSNAAGLLQSLVPRAEPFSFYTLDRECAWTSGDADDFEVSSFVGELSERLIAGLGDQDEALRRTLDSARTVLVLPVFDENREVCGLLVSVFSRNAGKSAY